MGDLTVYSNRLSIYDVYRDMNEKKTQKLEVYEKILKNVYTHIKKYSKNHKLKCFYQVPDFVMGYPIFNLNHCLSFLMRTLLEGGFMVKYFFPQILYITWDLNEINDSKIRKKVVRNNMAMERPIEKSPYVPDVREKNIPYKNMDLLVDTPNVRYKPSGKLSIDI